MKRIHIITIQRYNFYNEFTCGKSWFFDDTLHNFINNNKTRTIFWL
jgi:hypothetical protein